MKTLLGVLCLVSAIALGFYQYQYYLSEGVSQKKALFMSLSTGMNCLVAMASVGRLLTLQSIHNPYDITEFPTPPEKLPNGGINVEQTINNFPPDPTQPTLSLPWMIMLAVGATLVAPEVAPFLLAGW